MKPLLSRPPLARFQRIVQLVSRGPLSSGCLATELEVSRRTIERDIEFMRDQLGVDISATGHGYQTGRSENLCAICLRPVENSRPDAHQNFGGRTAVRHAR